MKTYLFALFVLLIINNGIYSQDSAGYQLPDIEIGELIDYQKTPYELMDKDHEKLVFLYPRTYKRIDEIATDKVNLAGLRINPLHTNYIYDIKYRYFDNDEIIEIEGIPDNAKFNEFTWSPDHNKIAFTNTAGECVELWCYDFLTKKLYQKLKINLNPNTGRSFSWFKDSKSLLVKVYPSHQKVENENTRPKETVKPLFFFNDNSSAKQAKTYSNLLQNREDELIFENAVTSELYKVNLNGDSTIWLNKDSYIAVNISPDGEYVLATTLNKPYSHKVPYTRFERKSVVYDKKGNFIHQAEHKPTSENLPRGSMAVSMGKRFLSWRSDKPSTLFWVEALDEGDPAEKTEFRDALFESDKPFNGKPVNLINLTGRFNRIIWGNANKAVVYTSWPDKSRIKAVLFDPSNRSSDPVVLEDRNSRDIYSNPGSFDQQLNQYNRLVLNIKNNEAFLKGQGYKKDKKQPFIDKINLETLEKERIFESDFDKTASIVSINNITDNGDIIIRLESRSEYPNLYMYNINSRKSPVPLTSFQSPFKNIDGIIKKRIEYKRADGLELSGMLYLPPGYDPERPEKLPLFMWAYPQDFKDRKSVVQTAFYENEFTYIAFPSPIYWVTKGYAVFDEVTFPVINENGEYPNDTFVEQIVSNAEAAITALDSLGFVDKNRTAVGGHSYGAFMVANLLTHSNLFSAGVALSGAYNRTLTPFGFQNEERSYWQAPDTYNQVSPFMHADKIKSPLLLIHGGKDSNVGTSVIQSERYYDALKSLGATSKLVILPYEDHFYEAYESVMHSAWEIDQWLEKYVKQHH